MYKYTTIYLFSSLDKMYFLRSIAFSSTRWGFYRTVWASSAALTADHDLPCKAVTSSVSHIFGSRFRVISAISKHDPLSLGKSHPKHPNQGLPGLQNRTSLNVCSADFAMQLEVHTA